MESEEMINKLMEMNQDMVNLNKELMAKLQAKENVKFEQATTPDGLPMWESKTVNIDCGLEMKKLEKEGWEPIGGISSSIVYRRPVKKQEPKPYGYER